MSKVRTGVGPHEGRLATVPASESSIHKREHPNLPWTSQRSQGCRCSLCGLMNDTHKQTRDVRSGGKRPKSGGGGRDVQ